MTPDPATLRDLLARMQVATGPDRDLDRAIAHEFGTSKTDIPYAGGILGIGSFTSSLDDAIALAEQFGIVFGITRHPWDDRNDFCACIRLRMPGRNGRISVIDNKPAPTRPLAVLVCLFDNLITKLAMDEDDRAVALSNLAASDAELLP